MSADSAKGETKMAWKNEFALDYAVPPQVEALVAQGKLHDMSWHNDVCPSFADRPGDTAGLSVKGTRVLWVDHPDEDRREMPVRRFSVTTMDEEWQVKDTIYEGDDIDAALAVILVTPEILGAKFADLLKADFTRQEWSIMRQRNRTETHPGVCHSHDFCDANMVMLAAMVELCLQSPADLSALGETSPQWNYSVDLWNAAWDWAKKNRLTAVA